MKALVLCGGSGSRLRPITHTMAKQLVPIANKPVLFYGLEAIRDAGIEDVGIVVGETAREIREAVGDGSRWGLDVTYITQDEPLGLAHAVLVSEGFLGDDEFVMYLGDNLIKDGISSFVDQFRSNKPNSEILLAHVSMPELFGVAELEGGKVIRLVEKPKEPPSDLALVGVYMFDHNIMDAVKAIKPSKRGEFEITDAIQWLIDEGMEVDPHVVGGWWKDTGRLEDMLEANRIMLEAIEPRIDGHVDGESETHGRVVVEEGARIINSTVRGPAIIGERTRVENSFIGPFTSAYFDVVITGSEVEHSIILENSTITDIPGRIEDSLIGQNVQILRSAPKPSAYRFMLGDNSRVGIP
ncbi:MAG: glucose-1-phosphate thymidylyltransferase [Actinobacteria bacterium]|nr:glucose-1-phosphate thymidylyltransferase [Actinomycetota bacterium]MCG2796668.1 glucose-1-phosphate thymidylyltransferase [Actinomycetes bacterium]MBU4239954.1 glucose-1-phosphate thymidylyltransferase [Actinomycetota bacterium]MBU4301788.1 glucose-1-phosphate thymidylyltransferase [Actinomycetota bacterium]MBU4386397.1 glucose-1-phosphate thymidylyltransferase [Actinomycetota bacterium]